MTVSRRKTSWVLWPLLALWRLLTGLMKLTGRLVAIVTGFVFLVAGILLSITIVGAIAGIPLAILGAMLIVRGLF